MGANRADDYVLAISEKGDTINVQIKAKQLMPFFEGAQECDYTPSYVEKNEREALLPRVEEAVSLQEIFDLDFWKDYNDKCISCVIIDFSF